MAPAVRVGKLRDRQVDHGELIGTRVRCRVPRTKDPGERFASRVEETEHRMEPEPALEMRRRTLLLFGVDLDQRRIDIQRHLGWRCARRPRVGTCPRTRGAQRSEHPRVDSVERAPDRRCRRDLSEDHRLIA